MPKQPTPAGQQIAEIPKLVGVMAYGDALKEAIAQAAALTLRVLDDAAVAWLAGRPPRT